MYDAYDSEDIEVDGKLYRVDRHYDLDMGEPWKEHDGHGPVTDWENRAKLPGERVLCEDRSRKRFYDFAEATKIAKRDGWGVSDPKPNETKAQQRARAVEQDFERLRQWCNDGWHWMGIVVTPIGVDGEEMDSLRESLWGIESDSDEDFIESVVNDCISQIEYKRPANACPHCGKALTK